MSRPSKSLSLRIAERHPHSPVRCPRAATLIVGRDRVPSIQEPVPENRRTSSTFPRSVPQSGHEAEMKGCPTTLVAAIMEPAGHPTASRSHLGSRRLRRNAGRTTSGFPTLSARWARVSGAVVLPAFLGWPGLPPNTPPPRQGPHSEQCIFHTGSIPGVLRCTIVCRSSGIDEPQILGSITVGSVLSHRKRVNPGSLLGRHFPAGGTLGGLVAWR